MNEVIVTHVQAGETLSEIAARYGVGVDVLQRWNQIDNPDLVLVGQEILVYPEVEPPASPASGSAVSRLPSAPDVAGSSWDGAWVGLAIVLALLLFLAHLKRRAERQISRSRLPSRPKGRTASGQVDLVQTPEPVPRRPQELTTNDGERLVSSELRQRYRDWILIDNVLLPTEQGTTQIDHILVTPGAVFVIETKDVNGWVFGSPGQKEWTQTYRASRQSRKAGLKSVKYKFYNPLRQNEAHAIALVKPGIVGHRWIRPVVVFVGDAQLQTADQFLPFDEHEKRAAPNQRLRMRGVLCMSLTELHCYIALTVDTASNAGLTRRKMESICARIRNAEIPLTAKSHAEHVDYVRYVQEKALR